VYALKAHTIDAERSFAYISLRDGG